MLLMLPCHVATLNFVAADAALLIVSSRHYDISPLCLSRYCHADSRLLPMLPLRFLMPCCCHAVCQLLAADAP